MDSTEVTVEVPKYTVSRDLVWPRADVWPGMLVTSSGQSGGPIRSEKMDSSKQPDTPNSCVTSGSHHYRRHPQNRKFMTYCKSATGVPSNGNGQYKKLWEFWRSGFDIGLWAYVCNRHTDTEIDIIQTCYSIVFFLTTSVLEASRIV